MQSYSAAFTISCAIASLATSTTKLAGFQGEVLLNSSNLYDDVQVSGKITTGATSTAGKTIDVWAFAQLNDTPTFPAPLDGTSNAKAFTSENLRNAAMELLAQIVVDNTANTTYTFAARSIATLFGAVPKRWGLWVAHDTGSALHATAGNHEFVGVGIKF